MNPSQIDHAPTLSWLLRKMAKAAIRRPWCIPHLVAALRGVGRTRTRLMSECDGTSPGTFIALIEHMGDIIAAEPVARYASRHYPSSPVIWVCREPYRGTLAGSPSVDRIVTVGCMTEWLLLWATNKSCVRTWDLHISDRACPVCGIAFTKPGCASRITYDTYLDFGNLLKVNCLVAGIPVLDEAPSVLPDPGSLAAVDRLGLPERFVVIHCESNESRKDWKVHKWRELVKWLTECAGLFVCEIGINPIALIEDTSHTRNLCGDLTLMQTAGVIARATLFIGIDSGPAHLANAAGTPGVVLLGRYHVFDRYTPYSGSYGDGSGAELVRAIGLASEISVQAVIAAASRRLFCPDPANQVAQAVVKR